MQTTSLRYTLAIFPFSKALSQCHFIEVLKLTVVPLQNLSALHREPKGAEQFLNTVLEKAKPHPIVTNPNLHHKNHFLLRFGTGAGSSFPALRLGLAADSLALGSGEGLGAAFTFGVAFAFGLAAAGFAAGAFTAFTTNLKIMKL